MRKGYISFYDHGKRFKNGNLNIRFSPYEIEKINDKRYHEREVFAWALEEMDTYIIGYEHCVGNYTMGMLLYNYHDDKCYEFICTNFETLMEGKTIKLYAYNPHEYERKLIKEFENGGC
jgi:hypothetical protein